MAEVLGGRYALAGVLGAGEGTVVHRARDLTTGRSVAVKVWRPDPARDVMFTARMRRENGILRVLDHPAIAAVLDTGEVAGQPYVVTELVDGGPVGVGRRTPGRAVEIAAQVCTALEAAWRFRTWHGAIGPTNVLLTRDGRVKVTDFGTMALPRPRAIMSPEQAATGHMGPQSDVYAVGCLLFALLTGRLPFDGEGHEVAYRHIVSAPPRLPGAVGATVWRAMAKVPADRHPSPAALRAELLVTGSGGFDAGVPG
jgi:serine/threonine-protein kinase